MEVIDREEEDLYITRRAPEEIGDVDTARWDIFYRDPDSEYIGHDQRFVHTDAMYELDEDMNVVSLPDEVEEAAREFYRENGVEDLPENMADLYGIDDLYKDTPTEEAVDAATVDSMLEPADKATAQ